MEFGRHGGIFSRRRLEVTFKVQQNFHFSLKLAFEAGISYLCLFIVCLQEAARLQRETGGLASPASTASLGGPHHPQQQVQAHVPSSVTSPTSPTASWASASTSMATQTPVTNLVGLASPAPGSSSSRESSLDPSATIHTTSTAILSTKSPRQIVILRSDDGFGFTLRHFIVYPPEVRTFFYKSELHIIFYIVITQEPTFEDQQNGVEIKEPLDTVFVKSVKDGGQAYHAGLQCGMWFHIFHLLPYFFSVSSHDRNIVNGLRWNAWSTRKSSTAL